MKDALSKYVVFREKPSNSEKLGKQKVTLNILTNRRVFSIVEEFNFAQRSANDTMRMIPSAMLK